MKGRQISFQFYSSFVRLKLLFDVILTIRESVSGNKNAKTGPLSKFKWNLNTAVTALLGDAANKYI